MAIGKVDQEHIELVTASSDGFIKLYQIKASICASFLLSLFRVCTRGLIVKNL